MIPDREPIPGHFWLATAPGVTTPGSFEVRDGWPHVHLVGELTPAMQLISDADDVKSYGPAEEDDAGITIHGNLKGKSGRVTVVGAHTTGRSANSAGVVDHLLRGRYAVLDAHVSADERFTEASARVRHLDAWADLGGPAVTFGTDSVTVEYERPAPVDVPVPPPVGGLLRIAQSWSVGQPSVEGAAVALRAWATWTPADAATIPTLVRVFVDPLTTLLTLLFQDECVPTELRVRGADGTPLTLLLPVVADEDVARRVRPLLGLADLGVDTLGQWFAAYESLTPLPQVVAGTIGDARRTVHNQLLELATAAEGLDRRLHPADRRLTSGEVEEALDALRGSGVAEPTKEILAQALNAYLWEPSFPQRLTRLVDETAAAAPGAVGRANRWRAAVVDARVGFAHSLPRARPDEDDVIAYYVLASSLRWVLTARMLLHAGVQPTMLAERLADRRNYVNFLATARSYLPRIYSE